MKLFPSSKTAENIVNELKQGSISTKLLIAKLTTAEDRITSQATYKSLRLLRKQGIILLEKKEAMLNQTWLQELENFAMLAEHAYRNPTFGSGHFLQMQDGDRITYEFKNPVQVDIFWNHVLYILFDAIPSEKSWFAYSSHCWFLLGRRKDESALRDYMNERVLGYLFTVGNRTALDRLVAKDFDGDKTQYYMREQPLFPRRTNHLGIVLNVFGDYVIEAQYDKSVTKKIEEFYKNTTAFNSQKERELELIVSAPSRIRFTISRNTKKAAQLRRSFEKHFYIK